MNRSLAAVAADGRIILDDSDPPRRLLPNQQPPRSSVAYAVMDGAGEWECGSGILRGTVGEKLADKSRPLVLSLERVSVVRSSSTKDVEIGGVKQVFENVCLELAAGTVVEVAYIDPTSDFATATAELVSAMTAPKPSEG